MVGSHEPTSEKIIALRKEQGRVGKLRTPDGTDIVETYYVFGKLLLSADATHSAGTIVVPFWSTKIPAYQKMMSIFEDFANKKQVPIPMCAHRLKIATSDKKNSKGEFYVFSISPAVNGDVEASLVRKTDPEYANLAAECLDFQERIANGDVALTLESQKQLSGDVSQPSEDETYELE